MKNLLSEYTQKYGIAEKSILADLGGDIEKIIKSYEDAPALPFASTVDIFSDAENIHYMVEREIRDRWLKKIEREAAVAICNALLICSGTIRISTSLDIEFGCHEFMCAWNDANQEKDKIVAPVVFDN